MPLTRRENLKYFPLLYALLCLQLILIWNLAVASANKLLGLILIILLHSVQQTLERSIQFLKSNKYLLIKSINQTDINCALCIIWRFAGIVTSFSLWLLTPKLKKIFIYLTQMSKTAGVKFAKIHICFSSFSPKYLCFYLSSKVCEEELSQTIPRQFLFASVDIYLFLLCRPLLEKNV